MQLNKRAVLAIIPVVSVCYLFVFWGSFLNQSEALLAEKLSRSRLEVSNLTLSVERYSNFGEGFVASLLQSKVLKAALKTDDRRYQVVTVDRRLSAITQQFSSTHFTELSVLVMNSEGETLFYYEDGDDPFAELDRVFKSRVLTELGKGDSRRLIIDGAQHKLQYIRRVNIETMRAPLYPDDREAVTIALLFDMPGLNKELQRLLADSSLRAVVSTLPHEKVGETHGYGATAEVSALLRLEVTIDQEQLSRDVRRLLLELALSFLVIVCFSAWVLLALIRRYITEPIHQLQSGIGEAIERQQPLPDYSEGCDEISQLGREFSQLYSQLQGAYESKKELAETDSLTRLDNRYTFGQCLNRMLDRSKLSGAKMALLYIDLDNFKAVNDRYGHEMGDLILREFSSRLCDALRITDLVMGRDQSVARLAGDEFGVLLPDILRELDLYPVCERIIKLFEGGFLSSQGNFSISASIGVAIYPDDGDNAVELTRNADAAMYQAKASGRDQYAFYSAELAERTRRERSIDLALKALPFDEFTLYYMPIINPEDGSVKSVEALLRWQSPSLGFVSPVEFIPIGEANGVFEALDLWVVKQALRDTPRLWEVFGEDLITSVNISSAQLNSGEFFLNLMLCFQQSEIPTNRIQLEITETFAVDIGAHAEANLALLKQAGFILALDDFGTGYTSLSQLVDYPLDVIKIDKSLVDRMVDTRGRDLVLSLIDFCKRQGFSVTVEGVETAEQAGLLTDGGADTLQGFYFFKPQPLEAFADE